MNQLRCRKTKSRSEHQSRPATVKTAGGRACDCHDLLEMLREQLELGHPSTRRAANDILRVVRALDQVAIGRVSRGRVLRYLPVLDKMSQALAWSDLQAKFHGHIQNLTSRLAHTNTPRPRVRSLVHEVGGGALPAGWHA